MKALRRAPRDALDVRLRAQELVHVQSVPEKHHGDRKDEREFYECLTALPVPHIVSKEKMGDG
jgi:hypothetical protein